MALPNVNFNQKAGGLGRPLAGTDYISGLTYYYPSGGTLPTGFSSGDRIKKVFSIDDAVALGITNASLGETKSVATYDVTVAGAAGDLVTLTCATIESVKDPALDAVKFIDAYIMKTADIASTTTAAAALAAAINAGTASHGATATSSVAELSIIAPAGEGIFLNSGTPYIVSITGTVAGTLTQPTGAGSTVEGVASYINILYYHISEYFRTQEKGELYVGLYVEETTYVYADVTSMINYAAGSIKQLAVYQNNTVWSTTQPTALQAIVDTATASFKPFQAVLAAEISGTADISTLTDISTLSAPNVSTVVAQDNFAQGYHLYKATGKSIGIVGTWLGAVSLAAVNESILWVSKFNVASVEFENLGFANGQVYSSLSDGLFESLNNYSYTFLRKIEGRSGSYFSDSKTNVAATSDYATIENNRVYQKITRGARASLIEALGSPLFVNADGTLSEATIGYFTSLANTPLEAMEAAGELSDYKIVINPSQDVLATSTIELTLLNIPTGVARQILVNVGFVKSL
jgi:hypothetical protein